MSKNFNREEADDLTNEHEKNITAWILQVDLLFLEELLGRHEAPLAVVTRPAAALARPSASKGFGDC